MPLIYVNNLTAGGSGGGGGGFDPTEFTSATCKLWCEPRLLTGLVDDDAVATFTDQSGLGNDLTQSTSGSRPIYKESILAGHPILRFDGSDDHFTLPNVLSGATSGEVFLIVRIDNDPPAASAQSGLWTMTGDGVDVTHFPFPNGLLYETWGTTSRHNTGVNPTPSLTSFRLYNIESSAGNYKIRLDGTEIFGTSTNTFSSFSNTPYLGRSSGLTGNVYLDGDIAGIIVFAGILDSTDRGTLHTDWAETIYGLTIA